MCDRQQREALVPLGACISSEQRQTDAAKARAQYEEPGQEREEESRQSLVSLREWICELLIKNQELRMSLQDFATNHRFRETDQ
jgi:hypothetical protein